MTLEEAIKKVQKLLALSESDNPNEAATAMTQAQKILTKYQISQEMLALEGTEEIEEEIEDFMDKGAPLDSASKFNLDGWLGRLGMIVAEENTCQVYITTEDDQRHIAIIGRASDVEKVRYLYAYFKAETQRLCKRDGKGCGRTWRNNYRHGVVDTLSKTIKTARKEAIAELKAAATDSVALVKVDQALVRFDKRMSSVNQWTKDNVKLNKLNYYGDYSKADAREQGREAGKEIKYSQARGALKS